MHSYFSTYRSGIMFLAHQFSGHVELVYKNDTNSFCRQTVGYLILYGQTVYNQIPPFTQV